MAEEEEQEPGRGRESGSPSEIPARGWRDILWRTRDEITRDRVSLVAAGLAFYTLLSIFPAIAAIVSVYGLVADAGEVQRHFLAVADLVPDEARTLLADQMTRVAGGNTGSLSFAALLGLVIALWSASRGTQAFMMAMNVAYNEREKRGIVKQNLIAIALTLCLLVFSALALVATVFVPAMVAALGAEGTRGWLLTLLRWPLLAVFFMAVLAALYRFAPSRNDAKWRWVTPGSVVAVLLWLVASMAFSFYIGNFASYNQTYGSLGAVVGVLMWFWVSAFLVILGAELNAETEHQTRCDSTHGPAKPMGERGAYVADTVGEKP
ncbi:MAG: YihY/virulence factor BrkB family protein [Kiloniellaceae bacterium]